MHYSKLIIAFLFFTTFQAAAQPVKRNYTQLYIGLGVGKAISTNSDTETFGSTAAFHVTIAPKDHIIFYRAGIQGTDIYDNTQEYKLPYHGEKPNHHNLTFSFSGGKAYKLTKQLNLQALAGISGNIYSKPEDIAYVRSARHASYSYYKAIEKTSFKPGVLLQAEAVWMPFHRLGLALGTYYHFVPGFSTGGAILSLNIGKIRPRGIGIY